MANTQQTVCNVGTNLLVFILNITFSLCLHRFRQNPHLALICGVRNICNFLSIGWETFTDN